MAVPIYGGVIVYREVLHHFPDPKYIKALASCFYAIAVLDLELRGVQEVMYRITN